VVAWLEYLAAFELQEEDLLTRKRGGAGCVFARDEGIPTQTRLAQVQRAGLGGAGASADGLVSQLDPDSATRSAQNSVLLLMSNVRRLCKNAADLLQEMCLLLPFAALLWALPYLHWFLYCYYGSQRKCRYYRHIIVTSTVGEKRLSSPSLLSGFRY
jgi:hypothetical protein